MPTIPMTPVESSQLEAIGHDPDSNTLAIRFKSRGDRPGSLYHYQNFTAKDFEDFKAADSKGSHFIRNVKPYAKSFPYKRISED